MARVLHIIASCTERKRVRVPSSLRLRSVAAKSLAERVRRWWERLTASDAPVTPAIDLYAGEHWLACRDLYAVAGEESFEPHLWVASAGYGLIPQRGEVRGYSATFAPHAADSVWRPKFEGSLDEQVGSWWSGLAAIKPRRSGPRSLAELAKGTPTAHILVVGSPFYVSALGNDIRQARATLKFPRRMIVVTSGLRSSAADLAYHQIESNSRLLAHVGGSRIGLHARVAANLLRVSRRVGFDAPALQAHYSSLARRYKAPKQHSRTPMTDEEVIRFIRANAIPSHSAGLRQLRASGYACEQKRFRRIFQSLGGGA